MTTSTPALSDEQRELLRTARGLVVDGLHVVPIGVNKAPVLPKGFTERPLEEVDAATVTKIESGHVRGLAVVTGPRSLHTHDGQATILVAVELEGRATASDDWLATWADALTHVGADDVMERLDEGWVEETPSGGLRWFLRVPALDVDHAKFVVDALRGRRAARSADGTVMAELLLYGHSTIVAPSHGDTHPSGRPWVLQRGGPSAAPVVTVQDLHTLANALAEVDEVDRGTAATSGAPLSGRAREVANSLQKVWKTDDTVALLTGDGWSVVGEDTDGSPLLERDNNPGHGQIRVHAGVSAPAGSVWTFSTSAAPFDEGALYRPLEVVAVLEHGGDVETAAQAVLDSGRVSLRPFALMPRRRDEVFPASTPTDRLARQITRALVSAPHPTISGLPFVLTEVTEAGEPVRLLSVDRDGGAVTWGSDPRSRAALLLSVVQPARMSKEGNTSFLHSLETGVVDAVLPGGRPPASLSSVRFVGAHPILTPSGQVVSEPGFHPREQALVTIPRRDQAFWHGYRVPTEPTVADAQRALDYLLEEVASDFPFETTNDLARYLAYLVTAAGRSLCTAAPMFAFDAADRGTGKGLAARLGRLIAFGTDETQGVGFSAREDDEIRKALVAAALEGRRVVHIDELPRDATISSTVLSELVTDTGSMTLRVLGSNTSVAIPPMLTTVCGNNVQLGADFNRRVVPIRMVHKGAGLAFERSDFRHANLPAWVRTNRPEVLAALHTILAHGLQNPVDARDLPSGFGSFETWSQVVLGALSHVTIGDETVAALVAADRRAFLDAQDEEGADWGPVMSAWVEQFGEVWVTPKVARAAVTGVSPAVELPPALLDVAGQGDAGAARRWGRELTKRRSTSVRAGDAVLRFEVKIDPKRGNSYRVVSTEAPVTPAAPSAPEQKPTQKVTVTKAKPAKKVSASKPKKSKEPVVTRDLVSVESMEVL